MTLPREPNVIQVLSEFADYIKTTKPAQYVYSVLVLSFVGVDDQFISLKEPTIVIQTVVEGLQIYFDKALGSNLLYRFERVQYAHIRREYWTGPKVIIGQEKEMSVIYGAEHLLRMLGKFSSAFFFVWSFLNVALFSEPTTNDSHNIS